jgi:DNA-directed RNA polymerase
MLTQAERERYSQELSQSRARRQIEAAERGKWMGETPAGRQLVAEAAGVVTQHLEHFELLEGGRSGRKSKPVAWALEVLGHLGCDAVAAVVVNVSLSKAYPGPINIHKVAYAVGQQLADEVWLKALHSDRETRTAVNRALRRASRYNSYARKRTKAREVLKAEGLPADKYSREQLQSVGLLFLETLRQKSDLFDIRTYRVKDGPKIRHDVRVLLTDEGYAWLKQAGDRLCWLNPVYLPMVETPSPWTDPYDGGFKTEAIRHRPFVRPKAGRKLAMYEQGCEEVFGAANALQETGWKIHPDVLAAVDAVAQASPERLRLDERKQRKLAVDLWLAKDYKAQTIYWPMFADFRGRLYPMSSYLQPQSWDFARGLLRFDHGLPLETEDSRRWFQIHGANVFGEDKVSFDARIDWVARNEREILEVAKDPLDCQWWTEADKPTQFLNWCLEYSDWKAQGASFRSALPISVDGSNNGLQLLSLLLRDPRGGYATNCLPCDTPQDVYQRVADRLLHNLRAEARTEPAWKKRREDREVPTFVELAQEWLAWFNYEPIPRSLAKRPVMTRAYGVSHYSVHGYVRDWYSEQVDRGRAKLRDGLDPFNRTAYLANMLWHALDEEVVAARDGMRFLQELAAACVKHDVDPFWVTPSGWPVSQLYPKRRKALVQFRLRGALAVHRIYRPHLDEDRMPTRNGRAHRNGMSPNFVHSLDAALLHRVVNRTRDVIPSYLMVHDSYGCHALHMQHLAQQLRQEAIAIFQEDQLLSLRNQIAALLPAGAQLPELPEYGDLDVRELENAEYFFA